MSLNEFLLKGFKKYWFEYYTLFSGGAIFSTHYLAHTIFIEKYKNAICMYENGRPKEMHPRINFLFKKVLQDLNISEEDRKLYEPFLFIGLDTYSIGAPYFHSGVKIGIPLTYAYSRTEDMNAAKIYVNKDIIDWSRPSARTLLNTLILPEEAKKFAIARQIIASQSYDFIRQMYSNLLFIVFSSIGYWGIYNKFNLVKRGPILRIFIYSCCAVTSGVLWLYQDNYFEYVKEKKINEILATKGPEYVKGGFEFYDKILQRNMAVRVLMDEHSRNKFTDRGEQNSKRFIFKKMLISERRNFFAEKLKEIMSNNVTTSNV